LHEVFFAALTWCAGQRFLSANIVRAVRAVLQAIVLVSGLSAAARVRLHLVHWARVVMELAGPGSEGLVVRAGHAWAPPDC
jgi:hypothetical protein